MVWVENTDPVSDIPPNAVGFVYELTLAKDNETFKYIGKKNVFEMKTLPARKDGVQRPNSERITKRVMVDENGKVIRSKAEIAKARKRGLKATLQRFDRLLVESNWQDYEGSSENTKQYELKSKKILEWLPTKRSLTYAEVKWQFKNDVLEKAEYLNDNINGRWFKGKLL